MLKKSEQVNLITIAIQNQKEIAGRRHIAQVKYKKIFQGDIILITIFYVNDAIRLYK